MRCRSVGTVAIDISRSHCYAYTLSGYLGSDSGSDSVTGPPHGSTTYAQGSNVGSYNVNYSSGSLASGIGYGFSYANNASAITVGEKALTASLTGSVRKPYDGTTVATLASSNYGLAGVYGTDDVILNNPASGSYDNKNMGTGKTVSVSGLALLGASAPNYFLAATSISGVVGQIGNINANDTAHILFQVETFGSPVNTLSDAQYLPTGNEWLSSQANPDANPNDLSPAADERLLNRPSGKPPFILVDPELQVILDLPPEL